ncbi:hypothetical protein [uncultured Methanoregula sp.]|uniref:hypothetical protein n=1 Tax=uncultured Methanoregula sp. TaxID=1005933 RepID=UPI002AABE67B|nr:hypothetical protein [uncultured Methanoregula sp.]
MDDLNLGSDESISRKISRLIINGHRHEAILTSRRIFLIERETGRIYQEIPYADIALVVSRVNAMHEPVLVITTGTGEEQQTVELVFVYQPAGQNINDLEKCVQILKEHEVPVENSGIVHATTPRSRINALSPSLMVDEEPATRNPALDRTVAGRPWQFRQLPPEDELVKSHFGTVAVIIVIFAVILGGAFFSGQMLKAEKTPAQSNAPGQKTVNTPGATPAATPVTPMPTPSVTPTPIPTETVAMITSVPETGIWAKISYPGAYSGTLSGDGRKIEVNSSGTQFIRLPFQNTTIDGYIEKRDGSLDLLEIGIYNGGTLLTRGETKRPFGVAEISTPVGLAKGYSVIPAPTPRPVAPEPTPDRSLVLHTVPPTGVWVRVSYPGTFSGSIGSNGDWKDIRGSGDQFYQLSMTSGVVEGFIEKSDSSKKNMVVGVYKDGSRVFVRNTDQPLGKVEIYTTV